MRRSRHPVWKLLLLGGLTLFVLFYPLLISMYVFLPLLIGFSGWTFIRGIEGKGYAYILFPVLYLVNLESNLSLPLLLTLFATMLYYLLFYPRVLYLKRCKLCVAVLSVLLIDLLYVVSLLGYDLLMDTSSIVFDSLLWYSLIADIVLAVF